MEEKTIEISLQTIAIAIVGILVVVVGIIMLVKGRGNETRTISASGNNSIVVNAGDAKEGKSNILDDNIPYGESDGVEVTVPGIEYVDGVTIVDISMNNHLYNVGDEAMQDRITFNGVKPSSYEVLSTEMGGHHAEVVARFKGELKGKLVIGVTEEVIIEIDNL